MLPWAIITAVDATLASAAASSPEATVLPPGFLDTTVGMVALGVVVLVGAGGALAYSQLVSQSQPTDGSTAPEQSPTMESPTADAETKTPQPVEELSDEEEVLRLLEENGGRMKQVNIVENTDWSKSKVSMLLSDMEEDDEISKLRVGRENIISLAGEEPDAAGSPFEE